MVVFRNNVLEVTQPAGLLVIVTTEAVQVGRLCGCDPTPCLDQQMISLGR